MTMKKLGNEKDFNSYVHLIQSYIPDVIRILDIHNTKFTALANSLHLSLRELGSIEQGLIDTQYLNVEGIVNLYDFIDTSLKLMLIDKPDTMTKELNLIMMRWLVRKGYENKKDLEFFESYISDQFFRKVNGTDVRLGFYIRIKDEMDKLFMLEGGFTINERYEEGFFRSEIIEDKK